MGEVCLCCFAHQNEEDFVEPIFFCYFISGFVKDVLDISVLKWGIYHGEKEGGNKKIWGKR